MRRIFAPFTTICVLCGELIRCAKQCGIVEIIRDDTGEIDGIRYCCRACAAKNDARRDEGMK